MNAIKSTQTRPRRLFGALAAFLILVFLIGAVARGIEPLPPEDRGIGIDEHPGATIPLDLKFVDDEGKTVTLGQYFNQGKPVILALVYYTCPGLCNLTLAGMTDGFKGLGLTMGKDYEVVTVSINPQETHELAAVKKQNALETLGKPEAQANWHFLVGENAEIAKLAKAVGFRYRYDAAAKQYLHASAIYALSPKGAISRYLYGISFSPSDLRMALVEASQGKIGTTIDQIILYCHRYDAVSHRYTLAAMNVMRVGGVLTMLFMGGMYLVLWLRSRRRTRLAHAAAGGAGFEAAPGAVAPEHPLAAEPKPLSH